MAEHIEDNAEMSVIIKPIQHSYAHAEMKTMLKYDKLEQDHHSNARLTFLDQSLCFAAAEWF